MRGVLRERPDDVFDIGECSRYRKLERNNKNYLSGWNMRNRIVRTRSKKFIYTVYTVVI